MEQIVGAGILVYANYYSTAVARLGTEAEKIDRFDDMAPVRIRGRIEVLCYMKSSLLAENMIGHPRNYR